MQIQFVSSVSPIVSDPTDARRLFSGALGLTFESSAGAYVFTEKLDGVKHLGLWPLSEAADACFGSPGWPSDVPVPQASVEFEVADPDAVDSAAAELRAAGYQLLHEPRTEPWGQTITRLLAADGLLIGVCYTPWFHAGAGVADAAAGNAAP